MFLCEKQRSHSILGEALAQKSLEFRVAVPDSIKSVLEGKVFPHSVARTFQKPIGMF